MELDPIWLAPLLFLVVFPPFWCAVVWLTAQAGWARLARRYRSWRTPPGAPKRMQSGRVGWANYNHVLDIAAGPDGLHLGTSWLFRIGHPPLLLPWSELHAVREERLLWQHRVAFDVGRPRLLRLRLPYAVFTAHEAGRALLPPAR